jgi:hypothetical protein
VTGLVEHREGFNHSRSDESNSNEKRLQKQALTSWKSIVWLA